MQASNTKGQKAPGYVLYEGPSLLDGAPVVVIVTGTGPKKSTNSKTGAMLQTWILRADIDPISANRTGADYAICGNCPHRGTANPDKTSGLAEGRGCYVNLGHAPLNIWRTYKAGKYPRAIVYGGLYFPPGIASTGGFCIGYGEVIRFGSYGDPGVVPSEIWDRLAKFSNGWTGYTHQSKTPGASPNLMRCMVSADTLEEARESWAGGYRTFRIVASPGDVVTSNEVICPATAEGGNKATCETCKLCRGAIAGGKSVAVVAHGAGKKYAAKIAASVEFERVAA